MYRFLGFLWFASVLLSGVAAAQLFDSKPDIPEKYKSTEPDHCIAGSLQFRLVINSDSDEGELRIGVYQTENDFLRRKEPARLIVTPAKKGTHRVCINMPREGTFAISGYQDLNGDGKLNKMLGYFAKEPEFVSNNAKPGLIGGVPYEKAKVDLSKSGLDMLYNLRADQ